MKIINHLTLIMLLALLIECKPRIINPAIYGLGKEHSICRLFLNKNNHFELIYYRTLEKTTGKWSVKNDTLILNSNYIMSNYPAKDSLTHNEKRIFLIKGNKLLDPISKDFYLKRIK